MEKISIAPFHLIGITVRTSNLEGRAAQDIPALWKKFLSENLLNSIPNKTGPEVYAVYTEYEGNYMQPYTTVLGCAVAHLDEVPEGMTGFTFKGGDYLRFNPKGNLDQGLVFNEWTRIWGMDLDRSYRADFEVYGEKAQNPADAEVDILIGIQNSTT